MKVIEIIEATQMRDLDAMGTDKGPDSNIPAATAAATMAIPAGAAADKVLKRARKLNRRFKGESVLATAVKRILPRVAGNAAFKAIPYAGLAAGFYFGAQSALKGDWLGAGLEVATSLPWVSLLGASVGISVIIAREVYDTVFEDSENPGKFVALEADLRDDYEGTTARLKFLSTIISGVIKDNIEEAKTSIEKKKQQAAQVQQQSDAERKSVRSAKDIKFADTPGNAAVGNPQLARQAFNSRQRTGQEYK